MNDLLQPRLPLEHFLAVVEWTPLVSIDLIVRDGDGRMLVGYRCNRPAQGYWFVPGGRIHKNERLDDAFQRVSETELGVGYARSAARFLGVFEHLYPDNFGGEAGSGTHYVVLSFRLTVDSAQLSLPRDQHSEYLWLSDAMLAVRTDVHPNTQAYCGM